MSEQIFRDLGKLARDRTRASALSVIQLVDDDDEKAALLASVAIDFIKGAAALLENDDVSKQEALGTVLGIIFTTLGTDVVSDAIKTQQEKLK